MSEQFNLNAKREVQAAVFVCADTIAKRPIYEWPNWVTSILARLELLADEKGKRREFENALERFQVSTWRRLIYGFWSVRAPPPGAQTGTANRVNG